MAINCKIINLWGGLYVLYVCVCVCVSVGVCCVYCSGGCKSVCVMHAKSLQPCPTLCDPMDYSPPGFSVHGILQARILE